HWHWLPESWDALGAASRSLGVARQPILSAQPRSPLLRLLFGFQCGTWRNHWVFHCLSAHLPACGPHIRPAAYRSAALFRKTDAIRRPSGRKFAGPPEHSGPTRVLDQAEFVAKTQRSLRNTAWAPRDRTHGSSAMRTDRKETALPGLRHPWLSS